MNRRHFIECSSLALAASVFPAGGAETAAGGRPIVLFTKGLEGLSNEELAKRVASLGITGLEAPIRRGGHIEPDEVADKLPGFVETMKSEGLTVEIATSAIVRADGNAETYLKALADSGVKRYRLGYHRYDLGKPIQPQLEEVRAKLKDLAEMNAALGVQGQYQNHRGKNFVGGPVWDIVWALEEIDPRHLGLAFDFAHGTVEGGNTWELNLRRAKDHVVAVYFKDFKLSGRNWQGCPLGEGVVDASSGELVRKLLPPETPVSLHVEYLKTGSEGFTERLIAAAEKDFATLDRWLEG